MLLKKTLYTCLPTGSEEEILAVHFQPDSSDCLTPTRPPLRFQKGTDLLSLLPVDQSPTGTAKSPRNASMAVPIRRPRLRVATAAAVGGAATGVGDGEAEFEYQNSLDYYVLAISVDVIVLAHVFSQLIDRLD